MSTIVRDSGMKSYSKASENLRQVTKALEEMKKGGSLKKFDIDKQFNGRRLEEVIFELYVSDEFVGEVKKANKIINLQIASAHTEEFATQNEEIRKELVKDIYGLSLTVINNVIANLRDVDSQVSALNSLAAVREYFDKNPNCNHPAVTKSALKEGWKPKKTKALLTIEEKMDLLEEESKKQLKDSKKVAANLKKMKESSMNPIWQKIDELLKIEFTKDYNKWFDELRPYEIEKDYITLIAPDKLIRDWIRRQYIELNTASSKGNSFTDIVKKASKTIKEIKIVVEGEVV